ncbi:MAG: beta-glucosidase [Candidatus Magasanikbacteria bacterium CG_4_10_14_0_8_um_filter_32_14]|uniref:beta-glucosidase n=1 Tax=Candidatus Magasanikbacteria bacterium CG_4_10_14_0_8_um_filter_32_14 TaxID=1974640 RepID=A0A2M7R9T0_9BACT|nr:MAG: beta-glucosidase [Candidatus Magasanikbacteria bacterium CG_4_10_14_0_8_um_filter_32_14]
MNNTNKVSILVLTILLVGTGAVFFIFNFLQKKPDKLICKNGYFKDNNFAYFNESLPIETRVADLLDKMTLEEKIGQMALIEKNSIKNTMDVASYNLGAVLSGFGGKPEPNTPQAWLAMVQKFKSVSQDTCLGIPILYGADAIHGHSNVHGATIFPHFIGLGASHNSDLVYQVAQATTEEMRATDIYWGFSPTLDVALDNRWGRMYETFGSDTDNVSKLGQAYIEGLQNNSDGKLAMLATAKHFVGLGAMTWGTSINKDYSIDQGTTNINEKVLRATHLPPFQKAIESGVASVMIGLNTWQGEKLSANSYLINDVLKKELGFDGFVVSDWYGVYEISPDKYKSLIKSINAGVDMVMLPFNYKFFISNIVKAVNSGDISEAKINDAVARILKAKFKLGLFDKNQPLIPDLSVIGSDTHRELARQAVRESLVLLKDNNKTLPLNKNTKTILIAGSAANNLGVQSGGWTVEWQGIDGNWIPGTTILDGIKKSVSKNTIIDYNLDGNFETQTTQADIGIAVVGEKPYAEGWGDEANPSLSNEDLATINNLRQKSKKLIVVIVSGRPLNIKNYAMNWDAIVAAWLPGTEGQGVADVLFGDYTFKGKLPVEWKL